ncbi:MAG: hypothetical protein LC754_16355 [Acidobacteria bacterium]|nr:hypothetical protein [Acidobacteriota bacterium]
MSKHTSPLDHVRVAAPCAADWERMNGDERVRFCGQCQLNVYNLSGMTKAEAEALITNAEGRLCVRFYRRADGTILTNNCPVGLRALKRRVSRAGNALLSSALGFFAGLGFNLAFSPALENVAPPRQHSMGTLAVSVTPPPNTKAEVGGLAAREPAGEFIKGRLAVIERDTARQFVPLRVRTKHAR